MIIREYQDTDYEAVKEILKSGSLFDPVWDSRSHLKAKIEQDPTSILVAEEKNEVVGFVLIISDYWTCFLYHLAVKENYRNKGIGSALITKVEEQLKNSGAEEVAIYVNEVDSNLQAYYEKRGYLRGGNWRCLYKKL